MRHAAAIVIALAACGGPDATTEATTEAGSTTVATAEPTTDGPTTGEPGCGFVVTASAAWPEADALFKQDPRWLGADDAYSIALGGDRVLWLFADTFIATSDAHVRGESTLIRNSVGVQAGLDPASASIEFAWQEADPPTSFFPEQADVWYWPGDGERIGDGLLIFLMAVHKVEGGLGFEVIGSDAVWIADADAPPASWTPITVATFREPGRVPGSASVLVEGEFLYAFGDGDAGAELLRWPLAAVGPQPLPAPEVVAAPALLATQVEFTVHHDPARSVYVQVQSEGFGGTDLAYRTAPALAGPWTGPTVFHRPPESDLENAFVYAGKAHPELAGADLVATYVANSFEFADLFADPSLYYPRFVRVTLGCASG